MISRRGLLVTMLGLPAVALARPTAATPPAVVGKYGAEIFCPRISREAVEAAISDANRRTYAAVFSAMNRHPPRRR